MEGQNRSQSDMKFSIVIPVFNEAENLEILHDRLSKVMAGLGGPYEIIFVDDGSTDASFELLKRLSQSDDKVKVIRFTRNFGQHIAITAGLDHSKGDKVILMDADLQDQPEEIPKLLAELSEDYDIVYGCRKRRQDSLLKTLLSKFYLWLLAKLTNQTINPELAQFRVMKRRVVEHMGQFGERYRFHGGLVAWLGFPYTLVDIEHGKRYGGKTKYSLWKMIKLGIEGIISFSDIPLRLIGYFGLVVSVVSFICGIYVLIKGLLVGTPPSGYTSTIVTVFFTGGVLLLVLGVIGHYIGKIHIEVKKRPLYVIKDIIE